MKRSKAFLVLKEHTQSTLDFAILVCSAVPQLKFALKQKEIDENYHLSTNSEFGNSAIPYSTEKKTMTRYKTVLGANILLSNFSFFEAYFFALIDEIIDFHGGKDLYINFIERKVKQNANLNSESEANLKKLRKGHNPKHSLRYRKFTRLIENESIVWPSQKLALYGLKQIINNKKRWKSVDIPNLITDLLTYNLDSISKDKFHSLRDDRNKIAHGKRLSYTLDKALLGNEFLFELAKDIDEHVVKNFMIIEKYR